MIKVHVVKTIYPMTCALTGINQKVHSGKDSGFNSGISDATIISEKRSEYTKSVTRTNFISQVV